MPRFAALENPSAKGVMKPIRLLVGDNLILSPAVKQWEPPNGKGYVANLPTCGPILILSPALNRWRLPKQQGSCSQSVHL